MKANIQSERAVVRGGKASIGPGVDCCCCPCGEADLIEDCGIDYIACDIELCYETCKKEDESYMSCPGDKWQSTIVIRGSNSFRAFGFIDSFAPPGENEFLEMSPGTAANGFTDEGFLDPENPIEIPPNHFRVYAQFGCLGKPPIFQVMNPIPGRYYLFIQATTYEQMNCSTGSLGASLCPTSPFSGTDYTNGYLVMVGSKPTESGCCPTDPSGALSVEYAFPCEGGGEVFKVTGLTIVYL
jgi:hypothetical protein